ncbi:hypothetical protein ADUPG1_010369, partial [Aduncisulcus paluster]
MCFINFPILSIEGLLVQSSIFSRRTSKLNSISIQMSSSTDAVIQTVEPEFVHEGDEKCCPIPGDAPNIKSAEFPTIKAIDGTKEEGKYGYDQSSEAQEMMKGEGNGYFTHISIPFSSSSPMKGAYICLSSSWTSPPSHLIFTLTSSKGDKTSKKYEFPGFRRKHWYFLPVDLPDVVLCEITGKGKWEEYFDIESLVFISREETPEEIKSREAKEKLWSEAPIVKPEFVKEGDYDSFGRDSKEGGRYSIPIPRDDIKLVNSSFSMVNCKNDSVSKESGGYDRGSQAQRMLKGESDVSLSHLSIPFPSPSPMKGAYICVDDDYSSPSLLFTFTDCDGKKTFKKYEFTRPKHDYEWHFLPIDLDNVVLCEIEGKGMWDDKNSRSFYIYSLVFLRGEDLPSLMSSSTDDVIQTVGPEFIHKGSAGCCPIPRDFPNVKSAAFPTIKAIDGTKEEGDEYYDQSSYAQKMMKGEYNVGHFTHISIPFSSSSSMKGAYICLNDEFLLPSHLIFTLTSSKGDKTSKKYQFPEFYGRHWFFLPVDLPDVVLCEITGKGRKTECFNILSLVFIREETPEEITSREAREKLWSETPVVKPEFVKEGDVKYEGRDSIPIPPDDRKLVDPSFSMVNCKNDSVSKESGGYDRGSQAQRMLKGESDVSLSHLSIPFPSPSPMKGAYICVDDDYSSPSLLFTFTDCDGKKTFKKYEFTRPKHDCEWHFLPIDLDNVVLCEIEGKGTWYYGKNDRSFYINSLVFLRGEGIPTSHPLLSPVPVPSSSSKTPTSTLPLASKPVKEAVKEEEEEIVIKGNDKDPRPKDTKQKKHTDKKKHNPKDGKPKYNPKHDSLTLTSASTLTSQCIIGSGGFGEVLLVLIDGIPFPCVLKKMLRIADKTVVKGCRKEFKVQLKLFTNPKCFNRIPRPLYILDLLDCDMKGVYGFLMEFCVGGSVSAFAKRWCADGKYVSVDDTADDSEPSDSDSSSRSGSGSESADVDTAVPDFDAMTLNPVKVCSLCVG